MSTLRTYKISTWEALIHVSIDLILGYDYYIRGCLIRGV